MDCLVIAKGELWLHRTGAAPRLVTSAFAREVVERDERSRRTTAWKSAQRLRYGSSLQRRGDESALRNRVRGQYRRAGSSRRLGMRNG